MRKMVECWLGLGKSIRAWMASVEWWWVLVVGTNISSVPDDMERV